MRLIKEDVVELIVTAVDNHYTYGTKIRNGHTVTDWVRINDKYLAEIGRRNTEKFLAACMEKGRHDQRTT